MRIIATLRWPLWSMMRLAVALLSTALVYSLIESAKLYGVVPRAYLGEAAWRAIRSPGAATLARDLK